MIEKRVIDVYIFETGRRIRTQGPLGEEIWHILAIVDGDQVVLKVWSKKKKRWIYFIENDYYLTLLIDKNRATVE